MKVYLDMDGVLVNFRKGIHEMFNVPYDYPKLTSKWNFWEDWDDVVFWDVNGFCTVDFWRKLWFMHDGVEMLDAILNKFNAIQIYLLSTPMPNSGSWTGKVLWVYDNMPAFVKRLIITQAPKSIFAGPDSLLIDDKDENIEEFIAAGGQGILVPRPWNKDSHLASQTVKIVKKYLEVF